MADNLVCPACRHATRKHGRDGCDAIDGSCWCDMTPETINGAAPAPAAELAAAAPELAPRCPDGHGPNTVCGYCAPVAPTVATVPDVEDLDDDQDDDQDDEPVDELDGIGSEYIADPVERIRVLAELAPEYVRPVEPELPAKSPRSPFADALMWWDAWHCTFCFSRYFAERVCCDRPAIPVQVLVLPRGVAGDGR